MANSTNYDMEKIYERIGSFWLPDSVYLFIISPIGLIGGFLNLFSFFILYKITITQTNLYKYLRFYSLNGSILCFIYAIIFISLSPRYYPYFLSYLSRVYRAFIFSGILTSLYFIGNLLDVIIALDRLSIFIKVYKPFTKLNPYLMCSIVILLSTFLNLPIYFSYYVKQDEEFFNEIKYNISTFTYSGRTKLFNSMIGNLLTFVQILIRDIMTLLMEIVISSIAFYYLRKFNKTHMEINVSSNTNSSTRQEALNHKIKKDRQLLLLILIQILLSLFSHAFICLSYIFAIQGVTIEAIYSICICNVVICFKHFSNFFIFYFFNSNFKKKFHSLFNLNFT
jgi:hypothetical protein